MLLRVFRSSMMCRGSFQRNRGLFSLGNHSSVCLSITRSNADLPTEAEQRKIQQLVHDELGGTVATIEDLEQQKAKIEAGDLHAMSRLGVSYLQGVDGLIPPDPEKGLELLYKSGIRGNAIAFSTIARYWAIQGFDRKAFEWFEKAANMGEPTAQWELGDRYERGLGVRRNFKKALLCYKEAADGGDARASHNLAIFYMKGKGVKKDLEKAKELLEQAAQGHVGEAYYQLSILQEKEGKRDEALESLITAAKVDTPIAQYNLAILYLKKKIEPKGKATYEHEATKWITKAADLGLEEAQIKAGFHYDLGIGAKLNRNRATTYFEEAAEQGNSTCKFIVAHRYCKGIGVEQQDISKARKYIDSLAQQGNILAGFIKIKKDPEFVEELDKNIEAMYDKINIDKMWNRDSSSEIKFQKREPLPIKKSTSTIQFSFKSNKE